MTEHIHLDTAIYNITDQTGAFSQGNILQNAVGTGISVARVNDLYVATATGSKGVNTFEGQFGVLTIQQNGNFNYTLREGVDVPAGQKLVDTFKVKVRDDSGHFDQDFIKFEILDAPQDPPALSKNLIDNLGGPSGFGEHFLEGYDGNLPGGHAVITDGAVQIGDVFAAINYWSLLPTHGDAWQTPGGNSKGTGQIWYDVDDLGVVTVTWDDHASDPVGARPQAFQVQFKSVGESGFDMTIRYEDVADTAMQTFLLPDGWHEKAYGDLDTMIGNTGIEGVWQYSYRDGSLIG